MRVFFIIKHKKLYFIQNNLLKYEKTQLYIFFILYKKEIIMFKNVARISTAALLASLFFSSSFGMEKPEEEVCFSCLPQEVIVEILSYLDAKELGLVSQVNKELNGIGHDEHLWKALSEQENLGSKAEEDTWKSHFQKYTEKRVVRLTVYYDPDSQHLLSPGVEIMFNGQQYNVSASYSDKNGRIPVEDKIILTRGNLSGGLLVVYSVATNLIFPMNSPLYGTTVYCVKDQVAGMVTDEIFGPTVSEDGKPLEIASIQLDLTNFHNGKVKYGWVRKKD